MGGSSSPTSLGSAGGLQRRNVVAGLLGALMLMGFALVAWRPAWRPAPLLAAQPSSSVQAAGSSSSGSRQAGPVQRVLVDDLTPVLQAALREHDASALLVVAPPAEQQQLNISWSRLGVRVGFVPGHDELQRAWHGWLHRACANGDGAALLTASRDGIVPAGQSVLAAAAAAQLGSCLRLSALYGRYSDKGDSLLSWSPRANASAPLSPAAFRSTVVFRDAFSAIYDKAVWGSGEANGGGSGHGSSFNYTTTIRAALPALVSKYGLRSMLDSSCGSMHWMPSVLEEIEKSSPGFRFMGTDVACSLVTNHTRRFRDSHPGWSFACVDYANQALPRGYDLIFSRDSLQHLPLHAAWMYFNNVKASGAKYLLVGSYLNGGANGNIKAGEYYSIDVTKPPFSVTPRPLEVVDEKTADGKFMLLYEVAAMSWSDPLLGLV